MPPAFQTLTLNQIDSSLEIAAWLSQFWNPPKYSFCKQNVN